MIGVASDVKLSVIAINLEGSISLPTSIASPEILLVLQVHSHLVYIWLICLISSRTFHLLGQI